MKFKVFNHINQFDNYIFNNEFNRIIKKIVLHQLWVKPENYWWGEKSVIGLNEYYKKQGRSFAFHIAIAQNKIWLCKDLDEEPDQSGPRKINKNAVAIEVDSVINHRPPSDEDWNLYIKTISLLMERFNISPDNLYLHKDFNKKTPCPDFSVETVLLAINNCEVNNVRDFLESFREEEFWGQ